MTKKISLLREQILSAIGERVHRHGFTKQVKFHSFTKICDFGAIKLHLSFIDHKDEFDVMADIGIRFEDVEELVNRGNNSITKAEKANTCTIGCELGNLSQGRQRRRTVRTFSDISTVTDGVLDDFVVFGLPYIEEFSNSTNALRVLSGDGPLSWIHSPIHGVRSESAVAMSLLIQGKQAAQELAKLKLAFLEEANDPSVEMFRVFLRRMELCADVSHP